MRIFWSLAVAAVLGEYAERFWVYSVSTQNDSERTRRVRQIKLSVLGEYAKWNWAYSPSTLNSQVRESDSRCVIGKYAKWNWAYLASTLNFNSIQLIIKQKQAIRSISSASYRAHTAPLFQQLNILPLEKLIISYRLKFMHSYHFKKLPLSFAELWITNRQRIPERELRDADNYYIPPHRIEIVKRMPLFTFPLAWNDADDIKYNPIQHLFMRDLKNSFLLPPLNV